MSTKKENGDGGELSKIRHELEEIRREMQQLAQGLKSLKLATPSGSSMLPYDGDVTTPNPSQQVPYAIGTPLQIVLQFQIPLDAGAFTNGQVSFLPDGQTQPVIWPLTGSYTTNLTANTVTFSVMPTAPRLAGPKGARKGLKPFKEVHGGTGRGTVIHTKLYVANFQAFEQLSLFQP